jgi:hypothetical protein
VLQKEIHPQVRGNRQARKDRQQEEGILLAPHLTSKGRVAEAVTFLNAPLVEAVMVSNLRHLKIKGPVAEAVTFLNAPQVELVILLNLHHLKIKDQEEDRMIRLRRDARPEAVATPSNPHPPKSRDREEEQMIHHHQSAVLPDAVTLSTPHRRKRRGREEEVMTDHLSVPPRDAGILLIPAPQTNEGPADKVVPFAEVTVNENHLQDRDVLAVNVGTTAALEVDSKNTNVEPTTSEALVVRKNPAEVSVNQKIEAAAMKKIAQVFLASTPGKARETISKQPRRLKQKKSD